MKKTLSLIASLMLTLMVARADEGMWLPYSLNGQNLAEMQAMGCKLTAEQIFSFNQPSIKDAIVQFGGGCTGEIISPEGLLLTNHHCGLSYVQKHSSIEHDYLTDGFWAKSKGEELPNAGLSVLFLNKVEDVTEAVLKGVTAQTSEADREELVAKNARQLEKDRKGERNVRIEIVPFYSGNQYSASCAARLGASASLAPTPTTGPGRATRATSTSSVSTPLPMVAPLHIRRTISL